ncbi:type I restriction endonuclease [Nitrosomonas nitrosa]|uniref:type I restriction endonuclease n=1 Tax=Nitrosomonas nitrosa TaxID=52442 RepID=UPI000D2FBAA2|nr:type I restriction endonuclease [Nitrosomonas nitrosa]MCO6434690.1 type I restriction enzyme HsdR N-terminal domain-containing protein [Nitrosomonas nitrosa]
MDLIDQLKELSLRIKKIKDTIQTEEATKTALVMPFIQILGYNVFDPTEVTPELIADVGTKKGEKVDYAILMNGKPIILFECKKSGGDLSINHASQLFRYFHVTEARFAVLTNGVTYRFFTDLEQPNRMDEKPFFEFNILDFKDQHVDELKKFTKSAFDVELILNTASDLKYTRAIRNVLADWMANPSEDFVRVVCAEVLNGKRMTPAIKEQFTQITKNAFQQFIGDKINERLKMAMEPDRESKVDESNATAEVSEINTTAEELEAFRIIRAILREIVDPKRVAMRDAKSYCAILFDDNNRKPICRLRFNNPARLTIGLFDEKEEKIVTINDLSDIYQYADQLKKAAAMYIRQGEPPLQTSATA